MTALPEIKKSRRTERRTYWQSHVESWKQSGQSKQAYCREQGLKPANLYRWCGRLLNEERKPRLIPVRLSADQHPGYSTELLFPDGKVLRMGRDADPAWISRLVRALDQPC